MNSFCNLLVTWPIGLNVGQVSGGKAKEIVKEMRVKMSKYQNYKSRNPLIIGAIIGIVIGLLLGALFYLLYGNVILFGVLMAVGNFAGMVIGYRYGRIKTAE